MIRSPINGIVLTRSVEPGQTVAAAFQAPVLFTLAEDLTQMELHVNVDEADIGKVQEGQEAIVQRGRLPGSHLQGADHPDPLRFVNDRRRRDLRNRAEGRQLGLSLRPGMTATADITVKKVENAVLVPSAALRFTPPVQEEKKPSRPVWSARCFRVRPVLRPTPERRTLPAAESSSGSGP